MGILYERAKDEIVSGTGPGVTTDSQNTESRSSMLLAEHSIPRNRE